MSEIGRTLEGLDDAVVELGRLAMEYATVNRVTYLADGKTFESDTDHTVMLALIACAVAQKSVPSLDVGLVAQFALVHDLVEAYAGDTSTFGGLSETAKAEKDAREAAALVRIEKEFGHSLPWVHETIEAYESLATPEARFVKTLDKITPKITRLVNERTWTSVEEFDSHCAKQIVSLRDTYAHDQDVACALYEAIAARTSKLLHDAQDGKPPIAPTESLPA
jgi:5'-deoxynucleotidase YfbR-like HD superfamily hydrolase